MLAFPEQGRNTIFYLFKGVVPIFANWSPKPRPSAVPMRNPASPVASVQDPQGQF